MTTQEAARQMIAIAASDPAVTAQELANFIQALQKSELFAKPTPEVASE